MTARRRVDRRRSATGCDRRQPDGKLPGVGHRRPGRRGPLPRRQPRSDERPRPAAASAGSTTTSSPTSTAATCRRVVVPACRRSDATPTRRAEPLLPVDDPGARCRRAWSCRRRATLGAGFDLLDAARGEPGYSPICHVLLVRAGRSAAPADAAPPTSTPSHAARHRHARLLPAGGSRERTRRSSRSSLPLLVAVAAPAPSASRPAASPAP